MTPPTIATKVSNLNGFPQASEQGRSQSHVEKGHTSSNFVLDAVRYILKNFLATLLAIAADEKLQEPAFDKSE